MTFTLDANRNSKQVFCMVQDGQVFLQNGIYYLKISPEEAIQIGQTGDNMKESKWFSPLELIDFNIDSIVDEIYPNVSITFDKST